MAPIMMAASRAREGTGRRPAHGWELHGQWTRKSLGHVFSLV